MLQDDEGNFAPVSSDQLRRLFRLLSYKPRLVVLNACFSEDQAEAIVSHVECAVDMTAQVVDHAAISFAKGLYVAIGSDISVFEAVEAGKLQAEFAVQGLADPPRSSTASLSGGAVAGWRRQGETPGRRSQLRKPFRGSD